MRRRDSLDAHLFAKRECLVSRLQIGSSVDNKQQGTWKSLIWPIVRPGPYLCGLTLLLKLLQLLGSEETHRFIASNEFSTCWHGGEDDIAAQPTEAVEEKQE